MIGYKIFKILKKSYKSKKGNIMFLNNIFSSENSFMDNFFKYNQNFIPNVDIKLKEFFGKKCNQYQKISFPQDFENDEIKQKKDEDILQTNSNSFFESIIGPYSFNFKDEIENDINSNCIELDESKEDNPNIPINSLDKRIPEVVIPIESSSSKSNIKVEKNKIFSTVYPKRVTIFTKAENKFEFLKINSEEKFINKKRRRNKEDDIRRMIGRRFFNDVLLNSINTILKKVGCKNTFEKFQQDVIYYLVKKYNKKVLDMTLEEIFTKKELYNENNLEKYNHNLKLINQIKSDEFVDIREITQIDVILNKRYYDLFKEYLTSNEFIEEINRLKNNNKKFDNFYIEQYIYYNYHFIDNFLKKNYT